MNTDEHRLNEATGNEPVDCPSYQSVFICVYLWLIQIRVYLWLIQIRVYLWSGAVAAEDGR